MINQELAEKFQAWTTPPEVCDIGFSPEVTSHAWDHPLRYWTTTNTHHIGKDLRHAAERSDKPLVVGIDGMMASTLKSFGKVITIEYGDSQFPIIQPLASYNGLVVVGDFIGLDYLDYTQERDRIPWIYAGVAGTALVGYSIISQARHREAMSRRDFLKLVLRLGLAVLAMPLIMNLGSTVTTQIARYDTPDCLAEAPVDKVALDKASIISRNVILHHKLGRFAGSHARHLVLGSEHFKDGVLHETRDRLDNPRNEIDLFIKQQANYLIRNGDPQELGGEKAFLECVYGIFDALHSITYKVESVSDKSLRLVPNADFGTNGIVFHQELAPNAIVNYMKKDETMVAIARHLVDEIFAQLKS